MIQVDDNVDSLINRVDAMIAGLRPALTITLAEDADDVVQQARMNASWSSRIPGAINSRPVAGGFPGVEIVVDSDEAPHARPYEGITGNATFRHPVYGNRSVWVIQKTRPFLVPALEGHEDQVVRDVDQLIDNLFDRI